MKGRCRCSGFFILSNRGETAVSRGTAILLAVIALVVGLAAWLIPVIKQRFIGDSYSVKVEILQCEEGEVEPVGYRTIVKMNIIFPIGSAPPGPSGNLFIRGENGNDIDVSWPTGHPFFVSEDNFDQGVTKWTLQDVYMPASFRRGTLRNNVKDLAAIWLPEPKLITD
jgi:hypothetical protein